MQDTTNDILKPSFFITSKATKENMQTYLESAWDSIVSKAASSLSSFSL